LVARFFAGFAFVSVTPLVVVYITETFPAKVRGRFYSLQGIFTGFAYPIITLIGLVALSNTTFGFNQ